MPKSNSSQSRFLKFLPYLLVGTIVGLIVVFVALSIQPAEFNPILHSEVVPAMVRIPGGSFTMGSDQGAEDERPAHRVTLSSFQIDATEVTNAQFANFVKETGYITVSERTPNPNKYSDTDPRLLQPGSATFFPTVASLDPQFWDTPHPPWWRYVIGANWKHPTGPASSLKGKMNHPVVQIAWEDALEFANWAGKRLPTEAEWEYAARGGLDGQEFCWGSAKQGDNNKWYANTFQGHFPSSDSGLDGQIGTAPVRSYPPNGYGLFDMSGNVWEWCSDWYSKDYYRSSPKENPRGPTSGDLEGTQPQRVRRGGSFLCAEGYCRRYLPGARDKNPVDSSTNHTGFRCAQD
jgi:formylglycine-generating enzyme